MTENDREAQFHMLEERASNIERIAANHSEFIDRFQVPGGWLYRWSGHMEGGGIATGVSFVPTHAAHSTLGKLRKLT